MTTPELLDQLSSLGISLRVVAGAQIVAQAPKGTLNAALQAEIRTHKTALVETLSLPPVVVAEALNEPTAADERNRLVSAYARWFARRMDVVDEDTNVEVYDVFIGTLVAWDDWIRTAPIEWVRRGLELIEQEDTHLGQASPWRNPV